MFEDTICQYIGTNKPIYVNYLRLSHLYSFTYVYMYVWKSPILAMRIEKEMSVKCLVQSNISFFLLVINSLIFSFPKCDLFLIYIFNNFLLTNDTIVFISSVQSPSCVQLFVSPWTPACQAFLSITNSWSLLKFMSIKSVMPSSHLILCCPLFLQPSIFPKIRVFSNESVLRIIWPKYWSFSISPSREYSGLISFRKGNPLGITGLISLQPKGLSGVFFNTTVQKHQFFGTQFSL